MKDQVTSAGLSCFQENERQAIARSHLRSLPEPLLTDLARSAGRLDVAQGETIHRQGETDPHLRLVVSGLLRVYVTAPDGRTVTVRYCRPGALIGAVSLFAPAFVLQSSIQAITSSQLLAIRPHIMRGAAERDARVACALLAELSERLMSFFDEIPGNAFTTVRQRIARHLIDLAVESHDGPQLVASISQQHLAEAVGTVREVVVRSIRELRQAGLVRTERDRIILLDPQRLVDEA